MDRIVIADHLAVAVRHVVDGERVVARQRKLISGLKPGGRGAAIGYALLAEFEKLLTLHKVHRERLRQELEAQCQDA
jgi:hypothetical protein